MAQFRKNYHSDFTTVGNDFLRDKILSLKSKGLLTLMFSLPENWNFSVRGLAAISKEGVESISSALKELEKAGYLVTTQLQDDAGHFSHTLYDFYDYPKNSYEYEKAQLVPSSEPCTENPYTANPSTENQAQLNKEEEKKEILSSKEEDGYIKSKNLKVLDRLNRGEIKSAREQHEKFEHLKHQNPEILTSYPDVIKNLEAFCSPLLE